MERHIRGPAYVLGNNIDTDQIIPAQHLVYDPSIESERRMFGKLALSGVPPTGAGLPQGRIPFVEGGAEKSRFRIVVAGRNFGCGSSREHAPLALAEAGIMAVVAVSYARIFFRNAVNGGYLIPYESTEDLSSLVKTGDVVEINLDQDSLTIVETRNSYTLRPLGEILPILEAGDIFEYARTKGMMGG